ncbi:histamine H1 receptor [Nematostella vectensis]|uniref:histamine H1 receptor n=1 Tax=Nematostella vectensis TaxID=45351 RepID=UPI00138FA600|nr:histamine H1 receptor [Nematostella vectensis]
MAMNSSRNFTIVCEDYYALAHLVPPWHGDPLTVALAVLYVIVIVSAIVGNVLVCIAVCISSSLRRATSSYFIFSLALSDIGTASLSMPFDLEALTLSGCWPKGRGEGLCIVWTVTYLITVPTSILNLFALSVDRYKTLRDPWDRFKESPSMTPRRAVAIIVFIWVYCLLFALVPVLGVQYYGPQTLLYGRCIFNISPTTSMVSSFLNFYLPMFAMCWIYYRIYQIAHTQYNIPTGLEKHDYSIVKPTSSLSQIGADKKSVTEVNDDEEMEDRLESAFFPLELQGSDVQAREPEEGDGPASVKEVVNTCEHEKTGSETVSGVENQAFDQNDTDTVNVVATVIDVNARKERSGVKPFKKNKPADPCAYSAKTTIPRVMDKKTDASRGSRKRSTAPAHQVTAISQIPAQRVAKDEHSDCELVNKCREVTQESSTDTTKGEGNNNSDPIQGEVLAFGDGNSDKETNGSSIKRTEEGQSDLERIQTTPSIIIQYPRHSEDSADDDIPAGHPARETFYPENPTSNAADKGINRLKIARCSTRTIAAGKTQGNIDKLGATQGSIQGIRKKRYRVFVKNTKAARTIAIIVSAYLTCWVPFTTISIVVNLCEGPCWDAIPNAVWAVLMLVGYLNSALNPLLFSHQNPHFRRAYRRMLRALCSCC